MRLLLLFGQVVNGRAQMVGAMLYWHPADLPQGVFDSFGERFKGFAKADLHRLDIGVGQHQVEEQMVGRQG
jgi:hypothetical protein